MKNIVNNYSSIEQLTNQYLNKQKQYKAGFLSNKNHFLCQFKLNSAASSAMLKHKFIRIGLFA